MRKNTIVSARKKFETIHSAELRSLVALTLKYIMLGLCGRNYEKKGNVISGANQRKPNQSRRNNVQQTLLMHATTDSHITIRR